MRRPGSAIVVTTQIAAMTRRACRRRGAWEPGANLMLRVSRMRDERPIDPKQEREVQALGAAIARELGEGPGAARIAAQRLRLAALEHPQSRLQPLVSGRLAWLTAATGVVGAVALTAFSVGQTSTFFDGGVEAGVAREVGISAEPPRAFEPARQAPDRSELHRTVAAASDDGTARGVHVREKRWHAPSEQRTQSASEAAAESSASPHSAMPSRRARVATGPRVAAGSAASPTSGLPRPEVDVLQSVRE